MSDEVAGTDWNSEEIRLCVESYVDHLRLDVERKTFNKAALYRLLSGETGRSPKSIERKFQNISAILEKLELTWITGLAPLRNYQRALADEISRHVDRIADFSMPAMNPQISEGPAIFVQPPPQREAMPDAVPDYIEALIRKFDPLERDRKNRALGEAGERLVLAHEMRSLEHNRRPDLARRVHWVSKEDGDGAGFDILSFTPEGREKYVEVKTTIGGSRTPFFVSRNERNVSIRHPEKYRLFRLFDFSRTPRAFELAGAIDDHVSLTAENYRAEFNA